MPDTLSDAKAALAHANKSFPASATATTPAPKASAVKSAAKSPSLGTELATKKAMVDKAMSALPKLHKGGPVPKDGAYNLKMGEHVLTAPEAAKAKNHALMAGGMKSLAKPAPKATASIGKIEPMPAAPKTFTDRNLEAGYGTGGANNVTTRGAKPGGTVSPQPNAKVTAAPKLLKA